jgi:hypothetical protein
MTGDDENLKGSLSRVVGRIFNLYLCCFTMFFVCCSSVPHARAP